MLTACEEKPEGGKCSRGDRVGAWPNPTDQERADVRRKTLKADEAPLAMGNQGQERDVTTGGERRVKARTAIRQEKPLKSEPRTWQRERNPQGAEWSRPPRTWETPRADVPSAWDAGGSTLWADVAMAEQTLGKAPRGASGGWGYSERTLKRSRSAKEDMAAWMKAGSQERPKEIHGGEAGTLNAKVAPGTQCSGSKGRRKDSRAQATS